MSTKIARIESTGKDGYELDITQFYGGVRSGIMLQLTQGVGFSLNAPGFVQLTKKDARKLAKELIKWITI